jgi:hypothetical protein
VRWHWAKQFGWRGLVPNAVTVGMLANPKLPDTAAMAMGKRPRRRRANRKFSMPATAASWRGIRGHEKRRIDALVVVSDIFFDSRRVDCRAAARRHSGDLP